MNDAITIKELVLREFIQAGGQIRARITGQQRGFNLVFQLGNTEKTLATARGTIRLFASLDTAGAFVRDLGIPRFEVDMASHQPGRLRSPRPDRAEALRHTRTRLHQQRLEFNDGTPRL
jgi:hypothetical protein